MRTLEDRYRSVLRLLPASYRAVWEEEMVATFLESMAVEDPDDAEWLAYCGRPSRSEVASVLGLAVRLRLGGAEAPPRSFVWGEAVRLLALMGLLTNAVLATMGVWQMLWIAGWLPWPPVPGEVLALAAAAPSDVWHTALGLAALLWVPAYLALVFGHRRAAQVLAVLALLPSVTEVLSTVRMVLEGGNGITWWSILLVNVYVVAALAAFHRDAPPVKRRSWLVAFGVGIALIPGPGILFMTQPIRDPMLLDWPGLWSGLFVAAAAVHLAGRVFRRAHSAPSWTLALALLAGAVLGLRVVSLLDYALVVPEWAHPATMIVGIVEILAVLAVEVPLAVLATQALRRLPAPPSPKGSYTST